MRRYLLGLIGPVLAAAAVLTLAPEARAGVAIGVDVDFGVPIAALPGGPKFDIGFGGRLGYRIGLGPVFLQPEVGGNYTKYTGGSGGQAGRVLAGARFGLGGIVQPQIYGHGGYGFGSPVAGPTADVGFALDLKLVPLFTFGAHIAYNVVASTASQFVSAPSEKWLTPGLHAALVF